MNTACRVVLAACCLYSPLSLAENWFQTCSEVLSNPEFSPLKRYFLADSTPESNLPRQGDKCFRLNNNQFLVDKQSEGLYLFDAKKNSFKEDIAGLRMVTDIYKEFVGKNNKRYALVYSSNTNFRYADFYQKYEILNLVSGNTEKPYIRYQVIDWAENPVSGLCGFYKDKNSAPGAKPQADVHVPVAKDISKPEILNPGTANVAIRFHIEEQDCKTAAKREYNKTFTLVDGIFKETKS